MLRQQILVAMTTIDTDRSQQGQKKSYKFHNRCL